jgi:hypothetical protein
MYIEAHAPRRYRFERQRLYRDLHHALPARRANVLLRDVLFSIALALDRPNHPRDLIGRRKRVASRRTVRAFTLAEYWREQRKVEARYKKFVAHLGSHPLVYAFPLGVLRFRRPERVICPHGRYRTKCGRVRALLEALGRAHEPRLRSWILADLKAERVAPRTDPNAFCASDAEDSASALVDLPQPGRPADRIRRRLLETLARDLVGGGFTQKQVCDYVAAILRTCFGEKVSAASLARELRRRPR